MVEQTIVGKSSTLSLSPLSSLVIIIIAWKREKEHRKVGLWIIGLRYRVFMDRINFPGSYINTKKY